MEAIAAYLALSKVHLGGKLEKSKNACMRGWVWSARWKAVESCRTVDSSRKVELGTNACMHAWVDLGGNVESYRKVASYRGPSLPSKFDKFDKFDLKYHGIILMAFPAEQRLA